VARYALITADADAEVGIFDGTSFRYGEDDMAAFKGEYAANTVWGNAEKQKWRRGSTDRQPQRRELDSSSPPSH